MRVSYKADPAIDIVVNLIRAWKRGEIEQPVMSASSGPKDYIRNHIWAIFDGDPRIARVLMVRGEYSKIGADNRISPPFLLVIGENGQAFDMADKEVMIQGFTPEAA